MSEEYFPGVIFLLVLIFAAVVVASFVVIYVFIVVSFLIVMTALVIDLGPVYVYTDPFMVPAVHLDWSLKISCIEIVSRYVEYLFKIDQVIVCAREILFLLSDILQASY